MAGERHGTASWPGVGGTVESCTYTCSHGISPGCAVLVCHATSLPAMLGDLAISDGVGTVVLPACKVLDYNVRQDGSGTRLSVYIQDRRWRWSGGRVDGCYNQLDPRGKLIPWTVRSPKELALLCLQAMGEPRYDVSALPPGLSSGEALAAANGRILRAGELLPATGTNPPINWVAQVPAQALQQVAEMFGCRVVYDPLTDSVLVAKVGQGGDLPGGSLSSQGPSLKPPDAPSAVRVVGSPTLFQCRLWLQPVGEEWDGSYVPIDLLSYAPPKVEPATQQWAVEIVYGVVDLVAAYEVFAGSVEDDPMSGISFVRSPLAAETADDIALALAGLINASSEPLVRGRMTASAAGPVVTITGVVPGYAFKVAARMRESFHAENTIDAALLRKAVAPQRHRWADTFPGFYDDAQATDRLTQSQAIALAQKTVFRLFQVTGLDVADTTGTAVNVRIPGYPGPIVRKQQIVLISEQVDQAVPFSGDRDLIVDRSQAAVERHTQDQYDGYSRGKAAAVYGSVAQDVLDTVGLVHERAGANTPDGSLVPVPFSVNDFWQMACFSSYVYRFDDADGTIGYPELQLQAAVMVRDAATNQLSAFSLSRPVPGGNPLALPRTEYRDDVQLNVTSTYDAAGNVASVSLLETDAIVRANHYLAGMLLRYAVGNGQMAEYNGIVPVRLDGAVMQATWEVGSGGASTTASRCFEYSPYVPPYPARRRAEALPPPADGGPQQVAMADAEALKRAARVRAGG